MMSKRHSNHNYFFSDVQDWAWHVCHFGTFLSTQNVAIKGISVKKRSKNRSGRTHGRTDERTDKHTSKFWRYLHNRPFGQLQTTETCWPPRMTNSGQLTCSEKAVSRGMHEFRISQTISWKILLADTSTTKWTNIHQQDRTRIVNLWVVSPRI